MSKITPRVLVAVVATALNVPQSKIVQHDRRLAESGLRSSRPGRPLELSTRDVAVLVIAAAAGDSYSRTADLVKTICDLSDVTGPLAEEQAALLPPRLREVTLPRAGKFCDAFVALLDDIAAGELDSDKGHFDLKIVPQARRAEINFDHKCRLVYQSAFDRGEPVLAYETQHTIYLRALDTIAKAMRGAS